MRPVTDNIEDNKIRPRIKEIVEAGPETCICQKDFYPLRRME